MNWILLRGLGRECRHWGSFPEVLNNNIAVDSVHCIDLPGNGEFYRQASPLIIRKYTQHVVAHAQEIDPPYGVIGLSLGGMVALNWSQRDAARCIEKLVLINTSTGSSPFYQRARLGALPTIFASYFRLSVEKREKAVLRLISNHHADDPDLMEEWIEIQRKRPVSRTNVTRQLLAAARFTPDEESPPCETLLLASDLDRLVDPICSYRLQNEWGWPLELHPTAGHDLPLDAPDWVIKKLRERALL